jgi:hypothetical protein
MAELLGGTLLKAGRRYNISVAFLILKLLPGNGDSVIGL